MFYIIIIVIIIIIPSMQHRHAATWLNVTAGDIPPPHHNNPLWPLHVWLRKTISSDIIDVTDVIVIKLSACEGPLCHRAV